MSDVRFEPSVAVTNGRRCRAAAYLPSSLAFTLNSLLPHFPAVALALSDLNTLGLAIRRRRRGWTDYKLAVDVYACVRTLILLFSNKNHTTNALLLMLSSRPVYTLSSDGKNRFHNGKSPGSALF
uniref:(northern house mosquito) hypothetical protein n=1 Tax=Culex pipiens TaxID=7175 RepID=A0A8D8C2A5_CULPI